MKVIVIIFLLSVFSFELQAKGMIFSLGGGSWSVENTSALKNFDEAKFIRLSHEGLLGKNFLYVFSAGLNVAMASADFNFEGRNSRSQVSELASEISIVQARIGFKYNLSSMFYIGAGGLLGDFQIDYDRDSYVQSGADTENYVASENQNYVGRYYEAGLMWVAKSWGVRLGAEADAMTIQKNMKTLGSSQPVLDSSKVYMEILWKN